MIESNAKLIAKGAVLLLIAISAVSVFSQVLGELSALSESLDAISK